MGGELSIVIPLLNEAQSLRQLYAEITAVCGAEGLDAEIIFVDDGSTDGSWEVIRELAAADPRVRGLRFRRNFGKAAALTAGFSRATKPRVMTLDADLQDDPREIPRFLAELEKGWDLVSGWKKVRHDPWHKVWPSRVFNWLLGKMSGVYLHDHNCGMKCYRREVLDEIHIYGELHRFIPVLAAARGFRVTEIPIHHRPRQFGKSKYGAARFVKGFLDLLTVKFLTGFGLRPQHFLGTFGLISGALGGFILVILAAEWFFSRVIPGAEVVNLRDRPLVIYSVALLLLGAQLISVGFLAELLTAYHVKQERTYSLAEEIGGTTGSGN
ncbi:glycosyltransferase family 2 protein [Thermogutta sp.]|uniref:glycosyltransferase family 2 protein n=1 Tax=Thermogutta sp. TaxID=1962930 RepID=UPI003220551C